MPDAKPHVILCALSDLKPTRPPRPKEESRDPNLQDTTALPPSFDLYEYRPRGFTTDTLREKYCAYHTNEGPVKLLLDKASKERNQVDHIVYLCSDLCKNRDVALREGTFTAEKYFRQRITEFVRDELGEDWIRDEDEFFCPIPYDVEHEQEFLGEAIRAIGENVIVDIDVTGAQRDAQLLLTPAIEFIDVGSDSVNLGTTVYANFNSNPKTLLCVDRVHELSRLVEAIDAFTRYGRAEGLSEFYVNGGDEVRSLCDSMCDFAADLSLCRVGKLQDGVRRVHECLDVLEQKTDDRDLRDDEKLLAILVPSIRAGFVSHEVDPAGQMRATIRWCVSHNMLQQALSLYKENHFFILLHSGLANCGTNWSYDQIDELCDKLAKDKTNNWADDVMKPCSSKRAEKSRKKRVKLSDEKSLQMIQVADSCESLVLESLAWFYVLKSIRNEVMHADGFGNEPKREPFIRAFVDSGYSNGFDPQYDKAVKEGKSRLECNDALARDILAALAVLEARSTLRPVATSV